MAEIKGYVAGSPATFTPSKKSKWIEEFNNLLVTSGYSRNALTEHLITVGLSHTEQQIKPLENIEADTLFNNAYFTPMERELLNTSTYQQIIREFAKSLLSNSRAAMEITFNQASTPSFPTNYPTPVRMESLPVQQSIVQQSDISGSPTQVQSISKEVKEMVIEDPVKEDKPVEITNNQEETEIDGYQVADLSAEISFLKGLKME
ncbi:hypothetical protein ACH0B6_17140 [Solibacillus silvestris]